MTDLEKYREDIVKNSLRLEIFCIDLQDYFETSDKAMHWLEEHFIPAFECAVEEREECGLEGYEE